MLWLPTARPLVVQAAVRVLPLPLSATALQPDKEVPPSVKLTVPVGELPLTVAVNVTLAPTTEGLIELERVVLVATPFTVCVSTALVDVPLLASPL